MTSNPVVHVIDDDAAARDSLAFLLKASTFSVRTHESAAEFLDALPTAEAGCIITDVRMPGIDGLELLRRLKDRKSNWPVIVITGQADVPLALEAIKAGAIDFIEKPYRDETVLGAVRLALGGNAGDSTRDKEKAEVRERMVALSAIERQVLNGLISGQLNKTIASHLGVEPRAIDLHRASVMTKMQAKSLSHLVRMMLLAAP
jgi:two-component system response regulator FixJ